MNNKILWNDVKKTSPNDGQLVLTCIYHELDSSRIVHYSNQTLRYRKAGNKYMSTQLHIEQYPTHWIDLPPFIKE